MNYSAESIRTLANLAQNYAIWLRDARVVEPGRLAWKRVGDREYLYCIRDGQGNGSSLGPRSADTERRFEAYTAARERMGVLEPRLAEQCAICRALHLPMLPAFAGAALRQLDIDQQLGSDGVLVVGTNALIAYAIEAGEGFGTELTATDDFDLTWVRSKPFAGRPVLDSLKRADRTWTVNEERSFQALNRNGEEIELLLPEKLQQAFPRTSGLRPLPLPEQDWLLPGRHVEHVVACGDLMPARIVAPDPRWFALHKLWLADKPSRNALKKRKDGEQGWQVLELVAQRMPHYPLDDAFGAELPEELRGYFAQWQERRAAARP